VDAIRSIVAGVIREALRGRGLSTPVLLRRDSPGHRLMSDWLEADFSACGVTVRVEDRAPTDRHAVVLDPASKDVLLLEGPLPGADLLPLGDVWSSRVRARDVHAQLSGTEAALAAVFEEGRGLGALADRLGEAEAATVRARLLATAPLLRPPVVPKLTEWTIGIDPGL